MTVELSPLIDINQYLLGARWRCPIPLKSLLNWMDILNPECIDIQKDIKQSLETMTSAHKKRQDPPN